MQQIHMHNIVKSSVVHCCVLQTYWVYVKLSNSLRGILIQSSYPATIQISNFPMWKCKFQTYLTNLGLLVLPFCAWFWTGACVGLAPGVGLTPGMKVRTFSAPVCGWWAGWGLSWVVGFGTTTLAELLLDEAVGNPVCEALNLNTWLCCFPFPPPAK